MAGEGEKVFPDIEKKSGSLFPDLETKQSKTIDSSSITDVIKKFNESGDFLLGVFAGELGKLNLNNENSTGLKTLVDRLLQTDDKDKIVEIMTEIGKIQAQYEAEKNQAMLESLLKQAKSIKLRGYVNYPEWSEVFETIRAELTGLNINLSREEIQKFEETFNFMKENAKNQEISLRATDDILDSMLDQAEQHGNNNGELTVQINQSNFAEGIWSQSIGFIGDFTEIPGWVPGQNIPPSFSLTFKNSEEAIRFVYEAKKGLQDIENINLYSWSVDILLDSLKYSKDGLVYLDTQIIQLIKRDIEESTTNGVWVLGGSIIAHSLLGYYLKTKLDAANSGIGPQAIDVLTNHLKTTIQQYEDAGYNKNEIGNMKKLYSELTEFFPETPEGINDQKFRARYVYSVLQKWRGTIPMDIFRFGATGVGRIFDTDLGSFNDTIIGKVPVVGNILTNTPIIKYPVKIADLIIRLHLIPLNFGTKLINKGPQGWGIFNTKSGMILDYSNEIEKSNIFRKSIFGIIDGIGEFTTEEKKALKRKILNLYTGKLPTSKLDPLKQKSFGRSIDTQAAGILEEEISSKLGYVPDGIGKSLSAIRKNASVFEAERENIETAKKNFLTFIEYYPEIDDTMEKQLKSIAEVESLTARTQEEFNTKIQKIIEEKLGKTFKENYVQDFIDEVKYENINTGKDRINPRIISGIEDILKQKKDLGDINETELRSRSDITKDFFRGDKTFWQAHLGLIIEDIIKGNFTSGIHSYDEVQGFITNGGARDVFSHLDNLKKALSLRASSPSSSQSGTKKVHPSSPTSPEKPTQTSPDKAPETPETLKPGDMKKYLDDVYPSVLRDGDSNAIARFEGLYSDIYNQQKRADIHSLDDFKDYVGVHMEETGIVPKKIYGFSSSNFVNIRRKIAEISGNTDIKKISYSDLIRQIRADKSGNGMRKFVLEALKQMKR